MAEHLEELMDIEKADFTNSKKLIMFDILFEFHA